MVLKTWMADREQQTIKYIPLRRAVAKSLANSALRELVMQESRLAVFDVLLLRDGLAKNRSLRTLKISVMLFLLLGIVAIILTHKQVENIPPEGAMDLIVNAVNIPTLETLDINLPIKNARQSDWQQSLGKALKQNQTLKSLRLVCDFCLLPSTSLRCVH